MRAQSLGDADCGEWLLAEPDVCMTMLPNDGCELILASDGLWDALGLPTVYAPTPSTTRTHAPSTHTHAPSTYRHMHAPCGGLASMCPRPRVSDAFSLTRLRVCVSLSRARACTTPSRSYGIVERFPAKPRRSVRDLIKAAVEAKGVHDDITVMLVRVVPQGRTGYWSGESVGAGGGESPAPPRMRDSLAKRLGWSKKETLNRPPSWHKEYYGPDPSMKGGELCEQMAGLHVSGGGRALDDQAAGRPEPPRSGWALGKPGLEYSRTQSDAWSTDMSNSSSTDLSRFDMSSPASDENAVHRFAGESSDEDEWTGVAP